MRFFFLSLLALPSALAVPVGIWGGTPYTEECIDDDDGSCTVLSDLTADFGFTIVDEQELEVVQTTAASAATAEATASSYEEKVNKLYNAILPLLSNLKKNPEKDYIYWPNRTEKVEQFEDMIANIIK